MRIKNMSTLAAACGKVAMSNHGQGRITTKALTLTLLVLGACSEPGSEAVASVDQPFGSSSCATAPADVTFSGELPAHIPGGFGGGPGAPTVYSHQSPSSYNTCFRGYVVDVNNLSASHATTAPDGSPAAFGVSWAALGTGGGPGDATPATQASCENTWTGVIFYKKIGSTWVAQGSEVDAYGSWSASHCELPIVSSSAQMTLVTGGSYRIAATARNTNGGSLLKAIRFSQYP